MTALAIEEDLLATGYGVQHAIREPNRRRDLAPLDDTTHPLKAPHPKTATTSGKLGRDGCADRVLLSPRVA